MICKVDFVLLLKKLCRSNRWQIPGGGAYLLYLVLVGRTKP